MRTISVLLSIFLSLQTWAFESHSAEMNNIADMKKRSEIIDEILAQRFEQILPGSPIFLSWIPGHVGGVQLKHDFVILRVL